MLILLVISLKKKKKMKYNFEQLINKSYQAIRNRRLITDRTNKADFIDKMEEELNEISLAYLNQDKFNYIEECVDLATVCIMQVHHLGYNFVDEFRKVVKKNEKRV